jgi:hypothetical protein
LLIKLLLKPIKIPASPSSLIKEPIKIKGLVRELIETFQFSKSMIKELVKIKGLIRRSIKAFSVFPSLAKELIKTKGPIKSQVFRWTK